MTAATLTVRRATAADEADLGRLGAALLRLHHEFDRNRFMAPGGAPEQGYASFLGAQLGDRDALVLVAEREGSVVGYLYASIEPRSWKELREEAGFIHDVYVDEGTRGAGVGGALVDAAVAWFRSRDMPRVLLWTATPNHAAQRLFARAGFRATMTEMTREL